MSLTMRTPSKSSAKKKLKIDNDRALNQLNPTHQPRHQDTQIVTIRAANKINNDFPGNYIFHAQISTDNIFFYLFSDFYICFI